MKKIYFFIIMIGCFYTTNAQIGNSPAGWITINLNDFMCNKASEDDPLNFDGYGNEIYCITFYSVSNQYGATKYVNKVISKVYGDTYRFPNRVVAGNANPDNKSGGLNTGNQFFVGNEFPNLKKIRVEAGDFITVIPTLWEWDNESSPQLQAAFESRVINSFNDMNIRMPNFLGYCNGYGRCYLIENAASLINFPSLKDILSPIINKTGSRPLGITANGEFVPIVIGITSKIIKEQRSNNLVSDGKYFMNYITFNINEDILGNTAAHGNFDLRYHFTFEEDFSKPTPPPPPPVNPNAIKPIKKDVSAITNALFTIEGKWKGTQTTDAGLYPQAVVFTLNPNGEMLFVNDASGAISAKGTYRFLNNTITGTFKQISSGETFSFSGVYDSNTKKMTCSLGSGTATSGQGKWVVTK